MEMNTCKAFCHSLAKAFSTGVRLYCEKEMLYYYSVYHLHPDPAEPYVQQIMEADHTAGVITTPLYQFYGFLTLAGGNRLILGPTGILQDNARELEKLLFLLGIPQEKKEEYAQLLRSAPLINAERLAWLLAAMGTSLQGHEFPVEEVWMQIRPESNLTEIQTDCVREHLEAEDDTDARQLVKQSYAWEQLVTSYIEEGQPEQLRDLFSSPPKIEAGRMAQDTLRQIKNMGICSAAGVSRAAIRGGMEPQEAFRMSDLYIQKLELLRGATSVEKMIQDMMIDFAEHVEIIKFNLRTESHLFKNCAQYVSENIFAPIRAEEIAHTLGYTRAYLCNQFKRQVGIPLTQYVQQEKILEAKRMLQFTDKDLSEIAALFAFSSQSHFQTVFKKIAGETPMEYRKRTKM